MAVQHIVLLQWKPEVPAATIEAIMAGTRAFKGGIPGVLETSSGENFSARSDGYTHASLVLLDSREALEVYRVHPVHQKVVQMMAGNTAKVLVVDYDC